MTEPILVSSTGGVYLLQWPAEQVTIRIDRLVEDSKFVVTAEVLVRTTLPGTEGHLHQARLNFTSTAARSTLAKVLTVRLGHLDWYAIIEQACVLVLRSYREGEPVFSLDDPIKQAHTQFRLAPLLHEGQPHLLYGAGGIGKSLIGAYCGLLIQTGLEWTGFSPDKGRVLYLDYEADRETAQERIHALSHGLGLPDSGGILYRFCHQSLPADISEIQRVVSENDISFIIVDSVGPACGGEPEDAATTIRYFVALRSLRVTSLSIGHVTKMLTKGTTPFGSVYWWNYSRSVYELKKSQEEAQDKLSLGLFHRKANNSRLIAPIGLTMDFKEGVITVSDVQVKDVPELDQHRALRSRLFDRLRELGKAEVMDLAEYLEAPVESVRTTLNKNKDTFIKVSSDGREGMWGLLVARET